MVAEDKEPHALPQKVYIVLWGDYEDMSIQAATLSEGVAEYLVHKDVGDRYEEVVLTEMPATFKPKLTLVYKHWMEKQRDFGETSFDPLLPDGDRALAYKWVEVLEEYEDVKDIFVPRAGNEEGLECHVSTHAHPSSEGQKEGILINVGGVDHDRVRKVYQELKAKHMRKWEGGS